MQPARQKIPWLIAMLHPTTPPHKASRASSCCLCSLISQVWEKHEAYTRISEANTCFRISLLQRITCFFTSLDPLSPSALEFSWFCDCLGLNRCCHSTTYVLVQNRLSLKQNMQLEHPPYPVAPSSPKIINLAFPFHPLLLFLTHSVS